MTLPNLTTEQAFNALKKALQDDPGFAWSWHCNISMAFYDEGGCHAIATKAAQRFMRNCFDVDTSEPYHYTAACSG